MKKLSPRLRASVVSLALVLAGCARMHKPMQPILFRHCALVAAADGTRGCDCLTPKIVRELDARTRKYRTVAYCDGKI